MRNVVYLVRARIENAQQIAEQIKASNRSTPLCPLATCLSTVAWCQRPRYPTLHPTKPWFFLHVGDMTLQWMR